MNAMKDVWNWLLSNAGIVMSSVSAVFGLFRDRWQSRLWKSLPIVGIVVGVLWALAAARHDARDHEMQMENTIKRVNDWVSQQTKPIKDDLDEIKTRMGILGVKATVAQSVSLQEASNILEAGNLAKNKVVGQSQQRRQALTIRVFDHFTKDVNYDIVKPRLKELADKVTVLAPLVDSPTNSVWWGPGSSLEEAKGAALIAVSAGVQIRQVCHSLKSHPDVSDLIQIGGSIGAQTMPVLSVEEIQNLNLPRCEYDEALAH